MEKLRSNSNLIFFFKLYLIYHFYNNTHRFSQKNIQGSTLS